MRRWAAVVLVACAGTVVGPLLVACGSAPSGLVVPVLWASESGGEPTGGVEPARVSVIDGDGGFAVDLATEAAQGAGPQWLAASGTAAVVGTLVSAADPRTIDVSFEVTGPIDGPSGGAALTVGVLAAVRGLELRDGVTMTGTISPDGSVGRVGLVPTKVRAAADAGYDLVLVPLSNVTDREPSSGLDVVSLGESLGIEVRPVANLGEAVAAFTGGPITAGADTPPPLTPGVAAVAADTAATLTARLGSELDAPSAGAAGEAATTRARQRLDAARAALDAGDVAGAYGAAAEGLLGFVRNVAAGSTATAAVRDLGGARAAVVGDATEVVTATDAALAALDDIGTGALPAVEVLSLPATVGWLTYARAAAAASGTAAERALGATELAALAGTVAEQRVAVEVMWPDARDSVLALKSATGPLTLDPLEFLEGYTDLLIRASESNEQYRSDVLAASGAPLVAGDPTVVATEVLRGLATGDGPEVVRASAAMSWWFVTTSAVAGRQAFGLDGLGLGGEVGVPASQATLDAAVRNAADTVNAAASALAARGVDPSAPVWSTAWGQVAAALDVGSPEATGEVIALGEAWYSALTVFMLLAASDYG